MSPAPAATSAAPACELAGRLRDYELALNAIARGAFDAARYRLLIEQLTAVGHGTIALPEFAPDFLELTVQHFELVRVLCRPRPAAARITPELVAALLRAQAGRVRAVRERCAALALAGLPTRHGPAAQSKPIL